MTAISECQLEGEASVTELAGPVVAIVIEPSSIVTEEFGLVRGSIAFATVG